MTISELTLLDEIGVEAAYERLRIACWTFCLPLDF